jgi:hypothetical protein
MNITAAGPPSPNCFFGTCSVNCIIYDCSGLFGNSNGNYDYAYCASGFCTGSGAGGGGGYSPPPPPSPSFQDLLYRGEPYPALDVTPEALAAVVDGCNSDPDCKAKLAKIGEAYRTGGDPAALKALLDPLIRDFLKKVVDHIVPSVAANGGYTGFAYSPGQLYFTGFLVSCPRFRGHRATLLLPSVMRARS